MPSGKPRPVSDWITFFELIHVNGETPHAAAKMLGISKERAYSVHRGEDTANSAKARQLFFASAKAIEATGVPRPEELGVAPRQCLDRIDLFALRYFGLTLQPWQIMAAEKVIELLATPWEEYLVVNAPPGAGKSVFFTRVIPAWLTCRDRTIRGQIGSASKPLARQYVNGLRTEFLRNVPMQPPASQERRGLQRTAAACLRHDYGSFEPDTRATGLRFAGEEFWVRQPDDTPVMEKEPTWAALSPDMEFIGMRADFVIWDDIVSLATIRNPDTRQKLYDDFDAVAETRLEPGGLFVLQGQRLSADDIYRHALNKPAESGVEDDGWDDPDPDDEHRIWPTDDLGIKRKYHHLCFSAHYDDICDGTHSRDAPAWPEGCLLSPKRLTWPKCRQLVAENPERWEITYQQHDTDPDAVLVNPIWVDGGIDETGVQHPGCWDIDRGLWQLPAGISRETLTAVVTVDPSPTKFWALQAWAVDPVEGFRYLLDCEKLRMAGSALLDWDLAANRWTGWLEDWCARFRSLGLPLGYVIVEQNAAQRFLQQSDSYRQWCIHRNVKSIPHQTHQNKSDPEYGVSTMRAPWRASRVRLPGQARDKAKPLVDEVTHWVPDGSMWRTDDQVMAQWFLEYTLPRLPRSRAGTEVSRPHRPSWVSPRRSLYAR